MSLIDKLGQGVPIAIIGYVMVFVVLGILWAVIELMRIVLSPKPQKKPKENVATANVSQPSVADDVVENEQVDESELVAVLTAAVAASLNTSTNKRPMIFRLASGSVTPCRAVRKRFSASTAVSLMWNVSAKSCFTRWASFFRSRPLSTNIQCS